MEMLISLSVTLKFKKLSFLRASGRIATNVLGICEVCEALAEQIWASVSEPHILLLSECDGTEAKRRVHGAPSYLNLRDPVCLK